MSSGVSRSQTTTRQKGHKLGSRGLNETAIGIELPFARAIYPSDFPGNLISDMGELVAGVMFILSGRLALRSREDERDGKNENQAD